MTKYTDVKSIAFVGSREFKNRDLFNKVFAKYAEEKPHIVSGGAKGPDDWAIKEADKHNLDWHIFYADWNKYGKSAGYKRNILVVQESDLVVAFWDGKSKGTKHTIDIAKEQNKPIDLYVEELNDNQQDAIPH